MGYSTETESVDAGQAGHPSRKGASIRPCSISPRSKLLFSEQRSSCTGQLREMEECSLHWYQLAKKVLPFAQVFIVQLQISMC